jgi:2,3-bisphosphoglycerate-independent phosphoglycerate mutase
MTKYAIIIMDGAADEPQEELGGQTPLEKANIPHTDWISKNGRLGLVQTVPEGFTPGSDVAQMSLLGYDPKTYYTGRAPLEAAARGINAKPTDWIFRCNLVTIADGIMEDYSAGHISTVQAAELIGEIDHRLGGDGLKFYAGVSYRHLMVHAGGPFDMETFPPHDILGKPIDKHLPKGKHGKELCWLMDEAATILEEHEINRVRRDLGENPANSIWLWGQGHRPQMDSFHRRFGLNGAVITGVDLMRGLGKLMGMDLIAVEGATGYLDTNYAGKGQAAITAMADHDLVVVHVEAPDEAGHGALLMEKVQAIEKIDEHVVGPLLEYLRKQGENWRIIILPDHPTPVRVRTHTADPVPFALAGSGVAATAKLAFTEANGRNSGLHIDPGCELMEYFLKG